MAETMMPLRDVSLAIDLRAFAESEEGSPSHQINTWVSSTITG
jgi:hypothetical protein